MPRRKYGPPALIMLCLVPFAVTFAGQPVPDAGTATGSSGFNIERLERIQSETLLLEAQALRARAELASRSGGNDTPPPVVIPGGTLPRIAEISGIRDPLTARLVMPDGALIEVSPGQSIAGTDITISRITARSVDARREDGSRISLPMEE